MIVYMRAYGQYCALAKALDVIGDRWSLLIVRELLIRGGCRYTDLRDGLPGIATNLLADRLRDLEQAGVIDREDAPPPVATSLFRLTTRGQELRQALQALGRWGAPLLTKAPKSDVFRSHWLALPASEWLRDHAPNLPRITIEIQSGGEALAIEAANGTVCIHLGPVEHPDAVISGTPQLVLALLSGKVSLPQARTAGLHYKGEPALLRRLQPGPA